MGITVVSLAIKNPEAPSRSSEREFLVDSGAPYTVIPRSIVEYLCLKPSFSQEFVLANGRTLKRSVGSALVVFEGEEVAAPVLLGEEGDDALLGVTTLASFGLMLDPFKRRIYPSKLMLG